MHFSSFYSTSLKLSYYVTLFNITNPCEFATMLIKTYWLQLINVILVTESMQYHLSSFIYLSFIIIITSAEKCDIKGILEYFKGFYLQLKVHSRCPLQYYRPHSFVIFGFKAMIYAFIDYLRKHQFTNNWRISLHSSKVDKWFINERLRFCLAFCTYLFYIFVRIIKVIYQFIFLSWHLLS